MCELVIVISKEKLDIIKDKMYCGIYDPDLYIAIANGITLPKGHGRLFDERDIVNGNYEIIGNKIYEVEPIIEADEAESEES